MVGVGLKGSSVVPSGEARGFIAAPRGGGERE